MSLGGKLSLENAAYCLGTWATDISRLPRFFPSFFPKPDTHGMFQQGRRDMRGSAVSNSLSSPTQGVSVQAAHHGSPSVNAARWRSRRAGEGGGAPHSSAVQTCHLMESDGERFFAPTCPVLGITALCSR